ERGLLRFRPEDGSAATPPPRPIARWDFEQDERDRAGGLHVTLHGEARRVREGLRIDVWKGFATTPPLERDVKAKTIEAWIRLDALDQRGAGVVGIQTLDGNVSDAISFGEREPRRWSSGSEGFARTRSFGGPEER